jgi:hypothetical protein
MISRS